MPMSLSEQYVYLLGVVLLYGSPLILLAAYLGWRRNAPKKALVAALAVPLLAAAAFQIWLHLDLAADAYRYESEARTLAGYSGAGDVTEVVQGDYVGTVRMGTLDYRHYQFPALDGSRRLLTVLVPPPGVIAAGFLRHQQEPQAASVPARLILWPTAISMNPALNPDGFFDQHVPGEAPHSYGIHTLIVAFQPRRSNVVYPPSETADQWVWRDAVNEL